MPDNGKFSELEKRIIRAEQLGQKWVDLHEVWIQLDEDKNNYLSALKNDLDDGNASEAKLERKARGSKEYRDYIARLSIARGEELRAKVRYENARSFFEAGRSLEATEREKLRSLHHIP